MMMLGNKIEICFLLQIVGSVDQIYGVELVTQRNGISRVNRVQKFRNGSGLVFDSLRC